MELGKAANTGTHATRDWISCLRLLETRTQSEWSKIQTVFFYENQQKFLFELTIITGTVKNSKPGKISMEFIMVLYATIRRLLL